MNTLRNVRQWPLGDVIRLTFAQVVDGYELAQVLHGEVITGGSITVVTPWDSGTSATVDLGDSDTADRYLDGVDLATAGRTAFTLDGTVYGAPDKLALVFAEAGTAATAGELVIEFTCLRENRATETV